MKKIIFTIVLLILSTQLYSQEISESNQLCIDCHEDDELTYERNGKEISLNVDSHKFIASVHGDVKCVDCHVDFDPEEMPHIDGDDIYKVDCTECHDVEDFEESIHAQENLECSDCHSKHEIQEAVTLEEKGAEFCITCHDTPNVKGFIQSVHYEKKIGGENLPTCLDCHNGSTHDIEKAKFTENELHQLCAECHKEPVENFEKSLHGQALANGKYLAPNCITCHNEHKILASNNEKSKTYKMNIPGLCGECHKDGTSVSELRTISQRHILENYSQSIHGDGLFKRGLIVTAVCTDCHFSHNILPHENQNSSISKDNIASTCMQCHVEIEKVHTKVIRGELWEKQSHVIPACIDCHQPHEVRRVFYEQNYTDDLCISCHTKENIYKEENGQRISLYINIEEFENSAHKDNSCIKCHVNVNVSTNPVCLNSGKVDCSMCHAEHVDDYNISQHGMLYAQNDPNAPYCTDCHGTHDMHSKEELDSPTFSQNIPELCAKCHREGEKAAILYKGDTHEIIENYEMSIHGKGLLESGLTVTATCVNCHTSHRELPASDPRSTVNKNNIAATCANCHLGIYEEFKHSIHSPEVTNTDKELPDCSDCHQSHTIARVDEGDFRQGIINQCGRCHMDVTETYFETFHGKVSKLGSIKTAKCYDCHGAHNILPTYNPESTLSRKNAVETCKSCHPNSNRKFVGYLTHATHHDRDKYPFLFYTFWAMTILLVGTFTFFGLHTLLWLPRALAEKRKLKKGVNELNEGNNHRSGKESDESNE
jgi:predicted CXXCH cytochrome family protein